MIMDEPTAGVALLTPVPHEHLRSGLAVCATHGRVTIKLAIEHIEILVQAGIMAAILPRSSFILLRREDLLGQAISRVIASQNLRWTSEHPTYLADAALSYSRSRIEQEAANIEIGNRRLFGFVTQAGTAPLRFVYETLVADPQTHLDQVASHLSLPPLCLDPARIRITRQANAINAAWRRRFLTNG